MEQRRKPDAGYVTLSHSARVPVRATHLHSRWGWPFAHHASRIGKGLRTRPVHFAPRIQNRFVGMDHHDFANEQRVGGQVDFVDDAAPGAKSSSV